MPHSYPPLNVQVRTPRLTLAGASDDLLEALLPAVRAGVVGPREVPFDDPMSLYADSPEREWRWLRGIWAGRAHVGADWWRLYFVVLDDGQPVGVQDLIGVEFPRLRTVSTFSWLAPGSRGRGIGKEAREAVLHLAFEGMSAREASTEAFTDNVASSRVSEALGYQPNGTGWATRRGEAAPLQRWRLTREGWEKIRRGDIKLSGVAECLPALGI